MKCFDIEEIYFTMKWVKGETLHDIIEKLRSGDKSYNSKYSIIVLIEIIQKVSLPHPGTYI